MNTRMSSVKGHGVFVTADYLRRDRTHRFLLAAAARDPPDRYIGFACAPRVFISEARFLC